MADKRKRKNDQTTGYMGEIKRQAREKKGVVRTYNTNPLNLPTPRPDTCITICRSIVDPVYYIGREGDSITFNMSEEFGRTMRVTLRNDGIEIMGLGGMHGYVIGALVVEPRSSNVVSVKFKRINDDD